MKGQKLVPATVNGRQVYVSESSIVPTGQCVVQADESFSSNFKKGAAVTLGVMAVIGAIGVLLGGMVEQ